VHLGELDGCGERLAACVGEVAAQGVRGFARVSALAFVGGESRIYLGVHSVELLFPGRKVVPLVSSHRGHATMPLRMPSFRPALRPVETILVPDPEHGRVLVLRDTEGVCEGHACLPPALVPIVARFTGEMTVTQIARQASAELGSEVPVELVAQLANELERALFLDGPAYRAARARVEREFREAAVRPASHAGGAYLADPKKLGKYIDESCLAKANGARSSNGKARIVGLVSPHIDPWRGAVGYGHAYAALKHALPPDADTFILFGTSHAPMRQSFALCRKAFDTPLGPMEADAEAVDAIAARCTFDPYTDQLNHKREHSLEFQVVFLKHLLGNRPARIVPVLAGLGEQQAHGLDPAADKHASAFLDGVRELVESRAGRAIVIAGADLAHVGPRFGDPRPYDAEARDRLAKTDRGSLSCATDLDAPSFWASVSKDLPTRRVCGLAPIYALLRTVPSAVKGKLLHYEQTIDEQDGSIVSHAAVGFYG
jgi:AmmeMemoRadiSam system protein B